MVAENGWDLNGPCMVHAGLASFRSFYCPQREWEYVGIVDWLGSALGAVAWVVAEPCALLSHTASWMVAVAPNAIIPQPKCVQCDLRCLCKCNIGLNQHQSDTHALIKFAVRLCQVRHAQHHAARVKMKVPPSDTGRPISISSSK